MLSVRAPRGIKGMFNQSNAEKVYKWLRKKGLARVMVDIAPHADDQDFVKCPITCRVTVVSEKDGEIAALKSKAKWKKLGPGKILTFTVGAESILGIIDRWWNKKKPTSYDIHIFSEPIGDFAKHYEPFEISIKLESGEIEDISVLFKPNYEGTRFNSTKPKNVVALKPPPRQTNDDS